MSTQVDPRVEDSGVVPSPYQGLVPYTERSAEFFFGRDADVRLIADNARAYSLSVLFGPSGVGKSSVLRAGVLRHIRDENAMRLERYGSVETVAVYTNDWRDDPGTAVARAVTAACRDALGREPDFGPGGLDALSLLGFCRREEVDLLLILDQFEELFLYHRDDLDGIAEDLADLTRPGSRVTVLIAIREDALAKLDAFAPALRGILENTLRLEHLDAEAARLAITQPLVRYNELVDEASRRVIEPALVDELLEQVQVGRVRVDSTARDLDDGAEAQAGVVRIEAAFLQLVLTRLWDEENARSSRVLRASTLRELGGAQEIVRQHLDRVVGQFAPHEVDVMVDAFGHLVTPSGSKIAHTASDLAVLSDHDRDLVASVLRRLGRGEAHILREVPGPMDEPDAESRFEIYHDVLALAVLDWRRRKVAEAAAGAQQAQLVAAREQAERQAEAAHRRLRRARLVVSGLALLVVGCLVAGLLAWYFLNEANAQEETARLNATLDSVNRQLRTDPSAALVAAADQWDVGNSADYQDSLRRALDAADTDIEIVHGSPVVAVFYLGDSDEFATVTQDGHVRVWRTTSDEAYRTASSDGKPDLSLDATLDDSWRIREAVLAGDGRFIVLATDVGSAHVIDLDTGEATDLLDFEGTVHLAAAAGGHGDHVVIYDESGHQDLWDVTLGRPVESPALDRSVRAYAVDPTDRYLATFTKGLMVKVWDLGATGGPMKSTRAHSPDDQTIRLVSGQFVGAVTPTLVVAVTGNYTEMSFWPVEEQGGPTPLDLDVRQFRDADANGRRTMAFAVDKYVSLFWGKRWLRDTDSRFDLATQVEAVPGEANQYAAGWRDGEVGLYELGNRKPFWRFLGHRAAVTDMAFSADGRHLITGSRDGTARVWRLPDRDVLWRQEYRDWMVGARYAGDSGYVFGVSAFGDVVRAVPGGAKKPKYSGAYRSVVSLDPAPDGSAAVVVDEDRRGAPLLVGFDGFTPPDLDKIGCCMTVSRWSPDAGAPLVAAGTSDGRVVTWDAVSGEANEPTQLGDTRFGVVDLEFSGDGSRIVASTDDGSVFVMSAPGLSTVGSWKTAGADSVDISADGRFVVTVGKDDQAVRIWNVETEKQVVAPLTQGRGTPGEVTFSPDQDSSRVAVTTAAGLVFVWDRESGNLLAELSRHADGANEVDFDPGDLDHLVSAGDEGILASYRCEPCGWDAADLAGAAARLQMQVIDLTD